MKRKPAAVIGAFIAIGLPLLFISSIYFYRAFTVSFSPFKIEKRPPVVFLDKIGPMTYDESLGDSTAHVVRNFSFKSLNGVDLSNESLDNDIRLVTFADTSSLSNHMALVKPLINAFEVEQDHEKNYARFHVLHHFTLPRSGAVSVDIPDEELWHIVGRSNFRDLSDSYQITNEATEMALVDANGHVRGIYDISDDGLTSARTDLQHLLRESYYTNKKSKRRVKFSE